MNDVGVFFLTRVEGTGLCAGLGNIGLVPIRFFFRGVAVRKTGQDSIATVRSFFPNQTAAENDSGYSITSMQDRSLESDGWGYGAGCIFIPLIFLALFVPGLLIGSLFKGLSYLINPEVPRMHALVKRKLTPNDQVIGSEDNPVNEEPQLKKGMDDLIKTGQEIKTLTVYAKNMTLNEKNVKKMTSTRVMRLILIGFKTKKDWPQGEFVMRVDGFYNSGKRLRFYNKGEQDVWQTKETSEAPALSQPLSSSHEMYIVSSTTTLPRKA